MNNELLNAVMAMDSYNRSYNVTLNGVGGVGSPLGKFILVQESNTILGSAEMNAGFYAAAYKNTATGEITISYRGTDQLNINPDSDVGNGWLFGVGNLQSPQGKLALEFYRSVVATEYGSASNTNLLNANITLTGHSLGGGLAGYIASLYGKNAYVYDSMNYSAAAGNTYYYAQNPSLAPPYAATMVALAYNGAAPWPLNVTNIKGHQVDGQALNYASEYMNLAGAAGQTTHYLEPSVSLGPIDRHDAALLIFTIYTTTIVNNDWKSAASSFVPLLFSDIFAQNIGIDDEKGPAGGFSQVLRQAIAYSVIDEGGITIAEQTEARPFGDTAIRAFYDDANDLGAAILSQAAGVNIGAYGDLISQGFVEYATRLALNTVLSTDVTWSLDGHLFYDGQNLEINYRDYLWRDFMNADSITEAVSKGALANAIINDAGLNTFSILQTMINMWGAADGALFDHIVLMTQDSGTYNPITSANQQDMGPYETPIPWDYTLVAGTSMTDNLTIPYGEGKFLFLAGDGDDVISLRDDYYGTAFDGDLIIYAGEGNDTVIGGSGGIYFVAGTGNETFQGSYSDEQFDTVDLSLFGSSNPLSLTYNSSFGSYSYHDSNSTPNTGTLTGANKIILGDANDIIDLTDHLNAFYIDAGNGSDTVTLRNFTSGINTPVFMSNSEILTKGGENNVYAKLGSVENVILESSSVYRTELGKNFTANGQITLNYSLLGHAMSASLSTNNLTVNHLSATDTVTGVFSPLVSIYGTNYGDNLTTTLAGTRFYSGSGNDTVAMKQGTYFHAGGHDTLTYSGTFAPSGSFNRLDLSLWLPSSPTSIVSQNYSITYHYGSAGSLTILTPGIFKPLIQHTVQATSVDTTENPYYAQNVIMSVGATRHGSLLNDNITGSSGDDYIYGASGNDTINGGDGVDEIHGGDGDDHLVGGAGLDSIRGGAGNDHLIGLRESFAGYTFLIDYMTGGEGTDTLDLSQFSAGIADFSEVRNFGSIEKLIATNYNDNLNLMDSSFYPPYNIIDGFSINGGGLVDTLTLDLGVYWNDRSRKEISDFIAGNKTVPFLFDTINLEVINVENLVVKLMGNLYNVTTNSTTTTGTSSADYISGSVVTDNISGLAGNDVLLGLEGDDFIEGGDGNDTINGGTGNDTLLYGSATAAVTVNLATTSAQNTVGAGTDTITNFENIVGSAYNDTLTGNTSANNIKGGNGNDTIDGDAGTDTLDGEGGTDTVRYASATSAITVNLSLTAAQNTGGAGTDTISNFENIIGSGYNDTLTGNSSANNILAGNGNDTIDGGAGNDVLNGEGGTDTLTYATAISAITISLALTSAQATGGSGSDTISNFENIIGSGYNDVLTGSTAVNNINGGEGNDTIDGGLGNDFLNGGNGTDTVKYSTATAAVTVNLATTSAQNTGGSGTDTISNFENLTGSAFNDILTGNSGNNTILGEDGADTIEGGAGTDILNGGNGTDLVRYSAATAAVTVSLALATAQNTGGAGTDTLSNFENLTGSAFNDTLTGNASANTILGGNGNDIIDGGAGNDVLNGEGNTDTLNYASATAGITISLALTAAQSTGGSGSDTISNFENLTGSGYNDTLAGNTAVNTIYGGNGIDTIRGDAGNDFLYGDGGDDFLYGDGGNDTLTGGSGIDRFIFAGTTSAVGVDTIADFTLANDKIDIKNLLSGYDPLTHAITDFVQITTSGANSILKVDVDGGANNFVQIATITGVTGLTDEAALVTSGNLIVS